MQIIRRYTQKGFEFKAGEQDALPQVDAFYRDLAEKMYKTPSPDNNELFAYQVVEPIREVKEYSRWTLPFFRRVPEDLMNPRRFASDSYTAVSFTMSPDGNPRMVRPARTTYQGVEPIRYETGLEFDLDQVRNAGWPIVEAKVKESGEELARDEDTAAYAVMTAAVAVLGGDYEATVSTSLTRLSFKGVVQTAIDQAFPVNFCVINTGTAMDMAEWTVPANSAYQLPTDMGREVVMGNGYLTTVNNIKIYVHTDAPSSEIWFGHMEKQDFELFWMEDRATETHPVQRSTQMVWWEDVNHYIQSNYRLRKLTIT
jgi:hypothetical protein